MVTINLILWSNGVGLTRDMQILREVWTAAGFEVAVTTKRRSKLSNWLQSAGLRLRLAWHRLRGDAAGGRFTFNVMLEHIRPEYLDLAQCNILIPNPEWLGPDDRQLLDRVDLVMVKTRHAESLFSGLGCRTRYLGFTSVDRLDAAVLRQPAFFHLAGRSKHKGTQALLQIWLQHPEWPRLTVVQNRRTAQHRAAAANIDHQIEYLSDAELRHLQNSHAFHLCPSETEGFGHYIVEALSVGAVTVTLDAPPMNELVSPERGVLVPYSRTGTHELATTFHFDETAMVRAVEAALRLTQAERRRTSEHARAWYLRNDAEFRRRAVDLLNEALEKNNRRGSPPD